MQDLTKLLDILPKNYQKAIDHPNDLIELVVDTGRPFELRYSSRTERIDNLIVGDKELRSILEKLSIFGEDNRAGINGTLHRVSRIVSRTGDVVGLTLRVGKPFLGCVDIIADLIDSGASFLVLGRPGIGKTTKLRDIARYLSETRRVVIVDTSNEIAGDGNVPHEAVGFSRRLQVPIHKKQDEVMIEAVENHMPEVVIIDEISTYQETMACRTIAQRGVQLIATAHGRTFNDLLLNQPLWGLIGGIKTVTLSDGQAAKRGCSKTVQEREMAPTFDAVVELISFDEVAIYPDVGEIVDVILHGGTVRPEHRKLVAGEIETVSSCRLRLPTPSREEYQDDRRQKTGRNTSGRRYRG
jgi:stage III sporulation protein SpoIIIAA